MMITIFIFIMTVKYDYNSQNIIDSKFKDTQGFVDAVIMVFFPKKMPGLLSKLHLLRQIRLLLPAIHNGVLFSIILKRLQISPSADIGAMNSLSLLMNKS